VWCRLGGKQDYYQTRENRRGLISSDGSHFVNFPVITRPQFEAVAVGLRKHSCARSMQTTDDQKIIYVGLDSLSF
jgi:hypothetical protein